MSKRDQWRHVVFKMTSRGSETMSRSRLIRIERSRSQNDRENSSTTSKTRATHFLVYTSWWRHRISVVDVGEVLGPEDLVALRQGHGGLAVGHVGGMNNIPAWLLWDYYHLPLYSPRSRLKVLLLFTNLKLSFINYFGAQILVMTEHLISYPFHLLRTTVLSQHFQGFQRSLPVSSSL